jgi:hypothetical protein
VSVCAVGLYYLYLRREGKHAKPAPSHSCEPVVAPYIGGASAEVQHFKVDHLADTVPRQETFPNPLLKREWPRNLNFVQLNEEVVESQVVTPGSKSSSSGYSSSAARVRAFVRAGPVEKIFWDPAKTKAAIVTCGGLCPGLNTVIREVVMCLSYVYGVKDIWGVPSGYCGFYSQDKQPWVQLTPSSVSSIHTLGGTILGSSRGGFDPNTDKDMEKILAALVEKGITCLFIIGGDGTHRGIMKLVNGAAAARLEISIIGIPKTIDNDIALCVSLSPPLFRSLSLLFLSLSLSLIHAHTHTHTHTHTCTGLTSPLALTQPWRRQCDL